MCVCGEMLATLAFTLTLVRAISSSPILQSTGHAGRQASAMWGRKGTPQGPVTAAIPSS